MIDHRSLTSAPARPTLAAMQTPGRERRTDSAAGDGKRETRYDRGELRAMHRTPEGFVYCEGYVAKPGVLVYLRGDGSTVRELLLPEVLHDPASLATMGRKPVTLEHPVKDGEPVDVAPDNVAEFGVGDVGPDVVIAEGGYVRVQLAVRRADAIGAMDHGTRELSPGYSVRVEAAQGIHPLFGPYDQIQRDRVYNHIAITEAARGGPDIRLRADSAKQLPEATMNLKFLRLCALLGVKRLDSEDIAMQDAEAKIGELTKAATDADVEDPKVEELEAQLATHVAAAAALQAKITALEGAAVDVPTAIDAIGEAGPPADPAAAPEVAKKADSLRRYHEERNRLEGLAAIHRIDAADVAKLGNAALRKAIVLKANPTARQDGAGDYYKASIDLIHDGTRRDGADPYAAVGHEFRRNAGDDPTAEAARRDAERRDTDPSVAFLDNLSKGFAARHATPAK